MSGKWSTQGACRVRVCAVLAMHVPNLAIHRLWHFPCASLIYSFSPQVKKKVPARACLRRSVKIGLLKTLGFVLRTVQLPIISLSLLQETKEEVHNTHDALIA